MDVKQYINNNYNYLTLINIIIIGDSIDKSKEDIDNTEVKPDKELAYVKEIKEKEIITEKEQIENKENSGLNSNNGMMNK